MDVATGAVCLLLAAGMIAACGQPEHIEDTAGAPAAEERIRPCPPGPVTNYLAPEAQQCWLQAARGRWRTLSHELHYDVLVVEAEAASLDDAEEIARRFVDLHGERFAEIMLYVQQEAAPATSTVRRLRWTADDRRDAAKSTPLERLDFVGSLPR